MNWNEIATKVGQAAPLLGGALGGPAGAAAGAIAASVLGVENSPEAISQALQDPEALEKLKRMDREHEREILSLTLEAETARLQSVNKTMRAELGTDGWFKSGWRPALGWVFAASLGAMAGVMAYTVAMEPTLVGDPEFTGMLVWLFVTMGAALGINVRERSKDKARMMGDSPKNFMDSILKR